MPTCTYPMGHLWPRDAEPTRTSANSFDADQRGDARDAAACQIKTTFDDDTGRALHAGRGTPAPTLRAARIGAAKENTKSDKLYAKTIRVLSHIERAKEIGIYYEAANQTGEHQVQQQRHPPKPKQSTATRDAILMYINNT